MNNRALYMDMYGKVVPGVVISRKKATDTGSLLTHFICLALGLLSMKQMERNCIISRVE